MERPLGAAFMIGPSYGQKLLQTAFGGLQAYWLWWNKYNRNNGTKKLSTYKVKNKKTFKYNVRAQGNEQNLVTGCLHPASC